VIASEMAGGHGSGLGAEGHGTRQSKRRGSAQASGPEARERATRARLSSSESSGADSSGTQSEDGDPGCGECGESDWAAGVSGPGLGCEDGVRLGDGRSARTVARGLQSFQRIGGQGPGNKWNCAHCGKPRRVISIPRRTRRKRSVSGGGAGSTLVLQQGAMGKNGVVDIVSNVGPMLKEMEENLLAGDKRLEAMMRRSLERTRVEHADTRYAMNDSINAMDVEELNAAVSSVTSVLHKIDLHNPNAREELKQSLWPVLVRHCFGKVPRNVREAASGDWSPIVAPTGRVA